MLNSLSKLKLQRLWLPFKRNLYKKPKTMIKFRKEQKAAKGKLKPTIEAPSVLVFTVHKSASTFVSLFLNAIAQDTNYTHLNYTNYFRGVQQNPVEVYKQSEFLSQGFSPKGFIYGPFRWNINVPSKESYKILLILRDPRDVLVSHYYSTKYSHVINDKNQIDRRIKALNEDLDTHVKSETPKFHERFKNYKELLQKPYDTFFLKYKDLIYNPDVSLKSLLAFMNVELKPATHNYLLEQLKLPANENVKNHRRSGKTGQFRKSLKPETIEFLNSKLGKEIDFFGFKTEN